MTKRIQHEEQAVLGFMVRDNDALVVIAMLRNWVGNGTSRSFDQILLI